MDGPIGLSDPFLLGYFCRGLAMCIVLKRMLISKVLRLIIIVFNEKLKLWRLDLNL